MLRNGKSPRKMHEKSRSSKNQGFFIEAGACDGEIISNSLYFEIFHKVSICININQILFILNHYTIMNLTNRRLFLCFCSGQDY